MSTPNQNGAVPDADAPAATPASGTGTPASGTQATGATQTSNSSSAATSRPVASLRLPPFSMEETELWLSQVECALGVAGITDDLTRYQVLVVNLPTEVAVQVRDVISGPSPTYTALTTALRDRLAQSRASRLEALLRHQQLGDQRPSELLRRMQGELTMAGVAPADNGLLRTLYKQRLPQAARAALSLLAEDIPLADLASAADRFMEAANSSPPAVHQVAQPQPVFTVQQQHHQAAAAASVPVPAAAPIPGPSVNPIDQLTASVAALTAAVGQMRTDMEGMRRDQRRFRSRGRSSSRRQNATRSPPGSRLCYYHQRFGSAARKCAEPCTWEDEQQGNDLA